MCMKVNSDMNREQARRMLCFPLDVTSRAEAVEWVDRLKHSVGLFKVGLELFTSEGPGVVEAIRERGADVFLDLKFHDIPNTVHGAASAAGRLGASILNVHASGGAEMMRAALEGAAEGAAASNLPAPRVVAVTLLTSIDSGMLRQQMNVPLPTEEYVANLAGLAKAAGLHGVVASPHEGVAIVEKCGRDFLVITPGIRPGSASLDDQKRVMSPASAVRAGAGVLVVGRPIRNAEDPEAAAEGIVAEIAAA